MSTPTQRPRGGFFGKLSVQVCIAVVVGLLIGFLYPATGVALKPLGDGFIRLVRMVIGPIIFGTVVLGIARMENLKEVGRIGVKALIYFEILSTLALAAGLVVANVVQPGAGMNIDVKTLDVSKIASYKTTAAAQSVPEFLLNIIPVSFVDSLAQNNMLQIIFFSVLVGLAMAHHREQTRALFNVIESMLHAMFFVVAIVMRAAPLGVLGGIAFTVGQFGLGPTMKSYGALLLALVITSVFFVFVVLGIVMRLCGLSLWRFLCYIKEEIFITFATVSTEAVLPRLMEKLEEAGCARPIVGLVMPAGYTFNLDGTSIYLSMAALFIAQATNTHLSIGDQVVVLGVLLLTSKGSGGVAGAGFVALAATLSSMSKIPVEGLVILVGIDRFLNESRAVVNLIGNGVATIAIAAWEKSLDRDQAREVFARKT